jgi:hypothetical protein
MKIIIETFNCQEYDSKTKRIIPFRVAKYVFDYSINSDDKKLPIPETIIQ